jgi:hypothetical protein
MQTDSSKSTSQAGFDKSRREKDSIVDKVNKYLHKLYYSSC